MPYPSLGPLYPQGGGPIRATPKGGRSSGGAAESLEGTGLCCDGPGARSSKMLFPLLYKPLLEVKAKRKE